VIVGLQRSLLVDAALNFHDNIAFDHTDLFLFEKRLLCFESLVRHASLFPLHIDGKWEGNKEHQEDNRAKESCQSNAGVVGEAVPQGGKATVVEARGAISVS
jgi:hypothetical protein